MVQVEENNEKFFQVKKKESYLNYPNMVKTYAALDSCFISTAQVALLASSNTIHLQSITALDDKKKILRLSEETNVQRIFSSEA